MAWTYATRTLRLPPARNPPLLCRRRCLHGREGSGLAAAWPHVHAGPRPPRSEIPPTCLLWKKAKGGRGEEVRWEEIWKKREINKDAAVPMQPVNFLTLPLLCSNFLGAGDG